MPDLVVNGWRIFLHPLFSSQFDDLVTRTEADKAKEPVGYTSKRAAKLLAAITRLAFEDIPRNPADPAYRQGSTLGSDYRRWFRAKFYQQYRLFFRFHAQARIIVYAWVNDEGTKRAYGSRSDAYAVFKKMLDRGNPPDDWAALVKASQGK